ncbi:MAG: T9SS type A sorting domain-containing protein [Ferruginibacter sp.]|nr:T9SS type A sorting domain-containing protein [Ferruginibacter sp.]
MKNSISTFAGRTCGLFFLVNKYKYRVGRVLVLAMFITGLHAQSYTWNNVAMGGGGFVTGLVMSKTQQNLMYARTDVGGAYRWDAANSKWISLLDWASENETSYQGVESFAMDPQANNKLYILAGTSYWNSGKTAILKSIDNGNTFSITDVSTQFKAHGNGAGRANGEKLMVDPNDGNILFCGTRRNGLFKSTDAGATWVQNISLGTIVTPNDNGISFVLFDPATGTPGNATQKIFVGVSTITATNFYVSINGGATFTPLAGGPSVLMPQKAVLAGDKNLYITYADKEGPGNATTGEVWKYNTLTAVWTNITPAGGTGYGYSGVSVDPNDAQKIIIGTINKYLLQYGPATGGIYGDRFYLTTNGGSSWRNLIGSGITLDPNGCTWILGQSIHWGGSIEFNPFNTNEAWVISGNGIFVCNDLSATNTTWKFATKGIEETVCNDLVSITEGPMFSVIGDYDGFKHTDITQYSPIHNPRMGSTNGIAYATLNTNKLLRVGSKMYYTTDQGATWTQCTMNGSGGKIALSANGNIFLHCPNGSTFTYRSADNGATWSVCNGISTSNAIPVADAVNSNKFYAYDNNNGNIYISTDGGINFTVAGTPGSGGQKKIRTVPGQEGHLWLALANGGLKRSVNSGSSYTTISGVTTCAAVGLGKAAPNATYFTIYIWGRVNGVTGVHRSTDEGVTWIRVNDDEHEYGGLANGQFVQGDLNVFGRVYMSSAGRGIPYGEDNTVLPVSLTSFHVNAANGFANLSWNTEMEAGNNYFDVEKSTDGLSFNKAGTVASKAMNGSSSIPLHYTFTHDIKSLHGVIYYRIKQVDRDWKFAYSKVLSINNSDFKIETMKAFPNPAGSNNINLSIQLNTTRNVQLRITNISGVVVYKAAIGKLLAGNNLINLKDAGNLSKGSYFIELMSEADQAVIGKNKLVIQ